MRFLICVILVGGMFSCFSSADETGYDHDQITTQEGRVYREVFVVEADGSGLMFRHRDGIAKVRYSSLSEGLRMLYEPVGDIEETPEEAAPGQQGTAAIPVWIEVRTRVWLRPAECLWECRAPAWPTHWANHAWLHRLSDPWYRELAVRDFLLTSGLMSRCR